MNKQVMFIHNYLEDSIAPTVTVKCAHIDRNKNYTKAQ